MVPRMIPYLPNSYGVLSACLYPGLAVCALVCTQTRALPVESAVISPTIATATVAEDTTSCREHEIAGTVRSREDFKAPLPGGLVFRLDAAKHPSDPSGWTIRITPAADSTADYAMVVTPPYRFSNARYIDTAYETTATAALEMTLRHFAFVASQKDYDVASESLSALLWSGGYTETEIARADSVLSKVKRYPGILWIDDGASIPVSADKPLGLISWIRFRAFLCLPSL